jgi:hypothetical protein
LGNFAPGIELFTCRSGQFDARHCQPLLGGRYKYLEGIAEGISAVVITAEDTFRPSREVESSPDGAELLSPFLILCFERHSMIHHQNATVTLKHGGTLNAISGLEGKFMFILWPSVSVLG